jgi:hypothetical protein
VGVFNQTFMRFISLIFVVIQSSGKNHEFKNKENIKKAAPS